MKLYFLFLKVLQILMEEMMNKDDGKFNIFVSYSWADEEERTNVIKALNTIDGITVLVDHLEIQEGDNIFNTISDLIDKANILLVLVSNESIKSLAVRDELVLAHERNLKVIEVCLHSDKCKEMEVELPSFMKDKKKSKSIEDVISAITKEKNDFQGTGFKYQLRNEFAQLRQLIHTTPDDSEMDNLFLKNILQKVNNEAKQIHARNYEVDLSRSYDFLKRAGSIFHSANEVYAVTVSWISDFWNDENNITDTINYLKDQNDTTIRLFVFGKPEEVIRFHEILNANYEKYGVGGAVLITSKEVYEKELLDHIGVQDRERKKYINSDFGVLEYDNNELYAWLDKSKLGFLDVSIKDKFGIDHEQFKKYMKKLKSDLEVGEFKNGVYRWCGDEGSNTFKKIYKDLFPSTTQDTISHIILFKDFNIVSSIAEIKSKVESFAIKDSLGCLDVWYGKVNDSRALDEKYARKLIKDNEYEYMLYMRFKNQDALQKWYQHPEHSDMRRKLYSILSSKVKELYEQIDLEENDDKINILFDEIEKEISKHIKRFDYTYEYHEDAIEHIKPYPFFKRYQSRVNLVDN